MAATNPWLENLLARLPSTGEAGEATQRYLAEHRVRVRVREQSTGASWTLSGNVDMSPSFTDGKNDAYALSLLVHEVHHLKQGMVKALSVEGELEAWQIQFAYLKLLTGKYSWSQKQEAIIAELISLSTSDREHLKRARGLMQQFAGKRYRIDLLPLYPLGREILFHFGFPK